jgi:hypothetical protein
MVIMMGDLDRRPAAGAEPTAPAPRRTGMRWVAIVAVSAAVLTGCASNGAAPGRSPASDPAGSMTASPLPTPTQTPSPLPEVTDPPIIGPGRQTLTGIVRQGAEPGCWILQTNSGQFELLNLDPTPTDGQTLRVSGHLVKVMSHCMQGRPFAVEKLTAR